MNIGHKLSHTIPALPSVVWMIGVITTSRLGAAAFKATRNNALCFATGNFGRSHRNAFQTTATLNINSKGGHSSIHASLQSHQARNITSSTHTIASDNIIRLRHSIFCHNLFKHRCPQLFCRNMTIHTIDHAYIAAQSPYKIHIIHISYLKNIPVFTPSS